jgi:hypothetical protein
MYVNYTCNLIVTIEKLTLFLVHTRVEEKWAGYLDQYLRKHAAPT